MQNTSPPPAETSRTPLRLGFRVRLTLWFAGLAFVTLACVGVYLGGRLTKEVGAARGEALFAAARFTAGLLSSQLQEREQEIRVLAASHLMVGRAPTDPLVRSVLEQRQAARSEYAWIGFADAQGRVVQSTQGLLQGQQVDARPWFKGAREGFFLGDLHEAVLLAKLLPRPADGEPLRFIDLAAPVFDRDQRFLGVLAAHLHWSWVKETLGALASRYELRSNVEVLIGDRSGAVLYPMELIGKTRVPTPGEKHAGVRSWEDGRFLTSIVYLEDAPDGTLGWRIALREPVDQALAPVRSLRQHLIWLGVFACVAFGALAYRFAIRVSRPLEALARSVRAVEASGEMPHPVDNTIPEIRELSGAVRSMTGSLLQHERKLAALNSSLEAQVEARTEELTRANAELARLATRDALTGLYNRRRFDELLREHFLRQRRLGQSFGLGFIDVDHFKSINDGFGHPAGDAVLVELAEVLRGQVRETDVVARYGGEEFVLLLPGAADSAALQEVGEKLRAAVAAADFPEVGRVTVSVGLSGPRPEDADAAAVIARADAALYRAKEQGRNRVVVD